MAEKTTIGNTLQIKRMRPISFLLLRRQTAMHNLQDPEDIQSAMSLNELLK